MRRMIHAVAAACLLTLATCGVSTAPPPANAAPAPSPVVETVMLKGTQALIVAEFAYQGAATAALVATRAGLITGETATAVKAIDAKAFAALEAGKTAHDVATKAAQASAVFEAVGEIRALLRGKQE